MILCVTLNPCLDKTLTVPAWQPGQNVRGTEVRAIVGGKGNNVARALRRLGRAESRPVTFLGGDVGRTCWRLLEEEGFDTIIAPTRAETRVIVTVRTSATSEQTAFFDPDPAISVEEARALVERVEAELAAGGVKAVSLSGSSPASATHAVYAELVAICRARGVPTFVDTYGPALAELWGFWPDAIQLNRREAGIYLKKPSPSDDDLWSALRGWSRRSVRYAAITDGPSAVFARVDGVEYTATPPAIDVVNPIGSGDCMLAGVIDAWLARRPPESILRWGVACAVANALRWDAGDITPARVSDVEQRVSVERY